MPMNCHGTRRRHLIRSGAHRGAATTHLTLNGIKINEYQSNLLLNNPAHAPDSMWYIPWQDRI